MHPPRFLLHIAGPVLLTALAILPPSATASTLMLDFGPTAVTGDDRIVSPYHTVIPTFTDTAWNQVQTSAITSGLLYSDGTAATGITVSVGRSSSLAWQTLTFAGAPSSIALGTNSNTGVFAGTSAGRDAINYGASTTTTTVVGVAVGGLAAGTYDIYIVGYNTNNTAASSVDMGFWALATSSTANLDTTTYLSSPQAASTNSVTGSWIEGSNYVKLSVTLAANQYMTIFSHGTTSDEMRGFLNSVQIVSTSSIPEPSTTAVLSGLGILVFASLVRRRPNRQDRS
ncbi:MAG: PEP-CTERM sorting domain-containing protein [Opitutaceae bacterium]|jgi:hypothetical protein